MRRALVTLAHPAARGHAARAPRPGRRGAGITAGSCTTCSRRASRCSTTIGIPAERTTILPGLARWRRLGRRARAARRRCASRGCARGADVLYSTTLSTLPALPPRGPDRAASRRWCTCTRATASARPYRKHWLGARAQRHRAVGRLARAGARSAVGGFGAGRRARASSTTAWTWRASTREAEAPPPDGAARGTRRRWSAWSATSTGGRTRRCWSRPRPRSAPRCPACAIVLDRRVSRRGERGGACASASRALGLARRGRRHGLPRRTRSRSCARSTSWCIRRCAIRSRSRCSRAWRSRGRSSRRRSAASPRCWSTARAGVLVPPDDRGGARRRRSIGLLRDDAPARRASAPRRCARLHDALHARRLRARRCSTPSTQAVGGRGGVMAPVVASSCRRTTARSTLRASVASLLAQARRRLRGDGRGRRLDRRHAGACWRRSPIRGCACSRIPHGGVAAARNAGHRGAARALRRLPRLRRRGAAGPARASRSSSSRRMPTSTS